MASLVTKTDKTTVAGFARTSWRTVGAICERVTADVLDPDRLCGLVDIGVDEISWRKHHRYLTFVSDHDTGKIIWGKPGKDTDTLNAFFDELPDGARGHRGGSMDMGPAYAKAVRERAPSAAICFDPFHVVKLVTDALDTVRRQVWQAARTLPTSAIAKAFKGARWALLKNPGDLTDTQAETLREMRHTGGILWRAYLLKNPCGRCSPVTSTQPPPASCSIGGRSRAQRCRIPEFVEPRAPSAAPRRIDAAINRGLSNGRHEGLNTKVRLLIRRAYGFHSAEAALALMMLACGPVKLELPYHTSRHPHSWQ